MKTNNLAMPAEIIKPDTTTDTKKDKDKAGGKRSQTLVDEYKAKLAKLESTL